MDIDKKEIAVIEKKVDKNVTLANTIIVTNDDEMKKAGDFRRKMKDLGKEVTAKKKSWTDPLNAVIKDIRETFAPMEEKFELIDSTVSKKMLDYQAKVDAKRKKEEDEAQAKLDQARRDLEKGKITETQAAKIEVKVEAKLEKVPEAMTRSESFHTRTIPKANITPLVNVRSITEPELRDYIQKGFIVWDEIVVRKAVISGEQIRGTERYEEKTLV